MTRENQFAVFTGSKKRERPSTMPLSKQSLADDSVRSLDLALELCMVQTNENGLLSRKRTLAD